MSARVTRKRSRAEENEGDLSPAKREPGQGVAGASNSGQVDEQARGGQVFRDEEFWFEDGTVFLVSCDVEFRVYKGVLAGLSPVFKALFADRSHATWNDSRNVHIDEEQTITCPVVRVSDSPADLRHLLRACFSKRLGRLYDELEPSYHEISAAIRLGDKYKITALYSQSMEYLKRHFTSNLDSWLELNLYNPPAWEEIESIGAINLGRMTGELSILPAAFLACICMDIHCGQGIGHGITLNDGSKEPDDLTTCFDGKSSIRTATATATLRVFKPIVSTQCRTSATCKKALRDVLLNFEDNVDVLLNSNPFSDYTRFLESAMVEVCPACTTMIRARSRKEHKDVWNRLPELLGIDVPGWEKPEKPSRADVT